MTPSSKLAGRIYAILLLIISLPTAFLIALGISLASAYNLASDIVMACIFFCCLIGNAMLILFKVRHLFQGIATVVTIGIMVSLSILFLKATLAIWIHGIFIFLLLCALPGVFYTLSIIAEYYDEN